MTDIESIALPTLNIVTIAQDEDPKRNGPPKAPRIPAPSHRHAAPSAPWPWLNLTDNGESSPAPYETSLACPSHGPDCDLTNCWTGYPQFFFPNWTSDQQARSGIRSVILQKGLQPSSGKCRIWRLDMMDNGFFHSREFVDVGSDRQSKESAWEILRQRRPPGTRVRAFFIERMTGPALQMLGARYKIEPFFFSSSLKWIPSRFQEDVSWGHRDHITFTLIFVGTKLKGMGSMSTAPPSPVPTVASQGGPFIDVDDPMREKQVIDIQEPLQVRSSDRILYQDLLSVHMIRSNSGSTLVSYHSPQSNWHGTQAEQLFKRIHFAGRSVYWQSIFRDCKDPTCLILAFLWHAVYSWDESQEVLYKHICHLESQVMNTNDMQLTQELHIIRAHILHYESLLDDFRKTVLFVKDTPNPALMTSSSSSSLSNGQSGSSSTDVPSNHLFFKECDHLLSEIERLKETLDMQDKRLKNVMNLTFSLVNIDDSRRMGELAEASGKDSTAMRQISYLTMVFLPASLIAAVFGMNVQEINEGSTPQLWLYLTIAFPLTLATIWIAVALQFRNEIVAEKERRNGVMAFTPGRKTKRWLEDEDELSSWSGLWWPILLGRSWLRRRSEFSVKPSRSKPSFKFPSRSR